MTTAVLNSERAAGEGVAPRTLAFLRRHPASTILVVALLVVGGGLGQRAVLGPRVAVSTVVQRDFVRSVVASGRVEAPHRVTIGAQITGVVLRVPVAEGQAVVPGQTLVELEQSEARAAAVATDLAVVQAQARLRQLREVQAPVAEQAVREAVVKLDNARRQLRRQDDLFHQGFIGEAALDNARRDVDLAEAQLRSARSQWQGAQSSGSDYAIAAGALAQARASAEAAHSRLRYATLVAPVAGTLIDRQVEPGDVVQPGKALMVLSPSGTTQVVVQIDEKNLQLLAVGQRARLSADAYPEGRFEGSVGYINPGVDAQRGSVEVKLDVAEPPDYLRQDMTVSVEIAVASRPGAVLMPIDAIHEGEAGQPWVLKVVDGRVQRQPVRLGLRGAAVAEVLEGLVAGDSVVASAQFDAAPGTRIRRLATASRP